MSVMLKDMRSGENKDITNKGKFKFIIYLFIIFKILFI